MLQKYTKNDKSETYHIKSLSQLNNIQEKIKNCSKLEISL